MPTKAPNDRLECLIGQAGFTSHKSLARAVVEESTLVNGPFQRCDHTVARWISGMTPRGAKPAIIAATISRRLGRKVTLADIGMASSAATLTPHLGLGYPETAEAGTDSVTALWHADLNESSYASGSQIDPAAWSEASLSWLVSRTIPNDGHVHRSAAIGTSDVVRFTDTVAMFAQLDDRFGGGHGRQSLIQYLATDGERLLRGRFTSDISKTLFSSVSEATLLAAWMSYDGAPTSGIAQRYFVQALALAQAGQDRLLGASILDAMSHQATFAGRYRDAANLAMADRTGTNGIATPTLTAHFYSMEARAHARMGDGKACDRALSEARKSFERRNPGEDPEWIRYFDEAELSAEIGHCFRDLKRPMVAVQYATQCLQMIDCATSPRSQFFAAMVLADAYLDAGEVDQACSVVIEALQLGEQIRSARCVTYLREFRRVLSTVGWYPGISSFEEEAKERRLWRIASQEMP